MIRLIPILLFTASANALTLHMEMTPELAGTNAVLMKTIKGERTRFVIPYTPEEHPGDRRYPMIREGTLKVYGDQGLLLRCSLRPSESKGRKAFSFELQNDLAKRAVFTFAEHRQDGQVGGGKVYSYRLLDFIDPGHRQREMLREIERNRARMLREIRGKLLQP